MMISTSIEKYFDEKNILNIISEYSTQYDFEHDFKELENNYHSIARIGEDKLFLCCNRSFDVLSYQKGVLIRDEKMYKIFHDYLCDKLMLDAYSGGDTLTIDGVEGYHQFKDGKFTQCDNITDNAREKYINRNIYCEINSYSHEGLTNSTIIYDTINNNILLDEFTMDATDVCPFGTGFTILTTSGVNFIH